MNFNMESIRFYINKTFKPGFPVSDSEINAVNVMFDRLLAQQKEKQSA